MLANSITAWFEGSRLQELVTARSWRFNSSPPHQQPDPLVKRNRRYGVAVAMEIHLPAAQEVGAKRRVGT